MKQLKSLLIVLFVSALASSVWAGPVEEVAAVGKQRGQAFNEGNIEAFMATWADDAVYTPPRSPFRIEGKNAIKAFYVDVFQQFPKRQFAGRQSSMRAYGDSLVISNGYSDVTLTDRDGHATVLALRASTVWSKIDGKWQVVDFHTSKIPGTQ